MNDQIFWFLFENNYLNSKKIILDNYQVLNLNQKELMVILTIISNFKIKNTINQETLLAKTKLLLSEIEDVFQQLIAKKEIIYFKNIKTKQIFFNFSFLIKKIIWNLKKQIISKLDLEITSKKIDFKTLPTNKTLNPISESKKNQFFSIDTTNFKAEERLFFITRNLQSDAIKKINHLRLIEIFSQFNESDFESLKNRIKSLNDQFQKEIMLKNLREIKAKIATDNNEFIALQLNQIISDLENLLNLNSTINSSVDYAFGLKQLIKQLPLQIKNKLLKLLQNANLKQEIIFFFGDIQNSETIKNNQKFLDSFFMKPDIKKFSRLLQEYKMHDPFSYYEKEKIIKTMINFDF